MKSNAINTVSVLVDVSDYLVSLFPSSTCSRKEPWWIADKGFEVSKCWRKAPAWFVTCRPLYVDVQILLSITLTFRLCDGGQYHLYNFCGFWSFAINIVYKLQFLIFIFAVLLPNLNALSLYTVAELWQFNIFQHGSLASYGLHCNNAPRFICWFWRYMNCLFVSLLSFLVFFLILFSLFIYFLTYLLPDLSTPSRIDPFCSQPEIVGDDRPKLALFFVVNFML